MTAGNLMTAEIAQAPQVFAATVTANQSSTVDSRSLRSKSAFYTVARGSSDAAANILSYEYMRELGVPMTSLPTPSFSGRCATKPLLGTSLSMSSGFALASP